MDKGWTLYPWEMGWMWCGVVYRLLTWPLMSLLYMYLGSRSPVTWVLGGATILSFVGVLITGFKQAREAGNSSKDVGAWPLFLDVLKRELHL